MLKAHLPQHIRNIIHTKKIISIQPQKIDGISRECSASNLSQSSSLNLSEGSSNDSVTSESFKGVQPITRKMLSELKLRIDLSIVNKDYLWNDYKKWEQNCFTGLPKIESDEDKSKLLKYASEYIQNPPIMDPLGLYKLQISMIMDALFPHSILDWDPNISRHISIQSTSQQNVDSLALDLPISKLSESTKFISFISEKTGIKEASFHSLFESINNSSPEKDLNIDFTPLLHYGRTNGEETVNYTHAFMEILYDFIQIDLSSRNEASEPQHLNSIGKVITQKLKDILTKSDSKERFNRASFQACESSISYIQSPLLIKPSLTPFHLMLAYCSPADINAVHKKWIKPKLNNTGIGDAIVLMIANNQQAVNNLSVKHVQELLKVKTSQGISVLEQLLNEKSSALLWLGKQKILTPPFLQKCVDAKGQPFLYLISTKESSLMRGLFQLQCFTMKQCSTMKGPRHISVLHELCKREPALIQEWVVLKKLPISYLKNTAADDKYTALHFLAKNDPSIIHKMVSDRYINVKSLINTVNKNRVSVLHVLSEFQPSSVIDWISDDRLSFKQLKNTTNKEGVSILHVLAGYSPEAIEIFEEYGLFKASALRKIKDKKGRSVLHILCNYHPATVKKWLISGRLAIKDISIKEKNGKTGLSLLATNQNPEILTSIMENEAAINRNTKKSIIEQLLKLNKKSYEPTMFLVPPDQLNLWVVNGYLSATDLSKFTNRSKETVLHTLAVDNAELLDDWVQSGDLSPKKLRKIIDENKQSVLHIVAKNNGKIILKWLSENRLTFADFLRITDKAGNTILHTLPKEDRDHFLRIAAGSSILKQFYRTKNKKGVSLLRLYSNPAITIEEPSSLEEEATSQHKSD